MDAIDVPALARIAARHPDVRLVALFGSVARGRALATSDVDLALLGAGFWDGLALAAELGTAFGREPHLVDLATASDMLSFEVARDGVLLYQREPDTWPRFRAESALRWFDVAPIVALCAEGVRKRLLREARGG